MAPDVIAPSALYARGVADNRWEDDPSQREVLSSLDRIQDEFSQRRNGGLWKSIQLRISPKPIRGLYLWGSVGRGKTFLTDLLLESLPHEKKLRLHFHRFMGRVHAELTKLEGRSDPLRDVAEHFAEQAQLFCLDEFFVTDIADAMILSGLLDSLFERGVTLVTTSNIQPDALYKEGLQRAKFLPAITSLKTNCEVRELQSVQDFRLRTLTQSGVYFAPDGEAAERSMAEMFEHIAPGSRRKETPVRINGRDIAVKRRSDAVIWFSFDALCAGPRAVSDYIELAQSYNTVLISGVPQLSVQMENEARRFINLVDEFYDHGVNLVIAADVPISELYRGERLQAEFERTQSRLIEMQSEDYLSGAHQHH